MIVSDRRSRVRFRVRVTFSSTSAYYCTGTTTAATTVLLIILLIAYTCRNIEPCARCLCDICIFFCSFHNIVKQPVYNKTSNYMEYQALIHDMHTSAQG